MEFKYLKLEIFIPETHLAQLQTALQKVDAGDILGFAYGGKEELSPART